jgi:hypothetical protein
MKCKNCGNELAEKDKFCSHCGLKTKINYSRKNFFDIYENITGTSDVINENPNFSNNYKKYLSKLYQEKNKFDLFMKSFNCVGYNLQLSIIFFGNIKSIKLPDEAEKILKSNIDDYNKIDMITKYLDSICNTIGPDKDVLKNYIPIDWNEFILIFEFVIEDFMSSLIEKLSIKKDMVKIFYEIGYRNAVAGYIFSVVEEILNLKK